MSDLVTPGILMLAQEAANEIDHEDHDEAVRVALDVAAPLLIHAARQPELRIKAEQAVAVLLASERGADTPDIRDWADAKRILKADK